MEIPGDWALGNRPGRCDRCADDAVFWDRSKNRVESVRLHRKYAHSSRRGDLGTFEWHVGNWQIHKPLHIMASLLRPDT